MRFHHSTRRGRNRLSGTHSAPSGSHCVGGRRSATSARWSQLAYCRQTNIYFNRRVPVEPPPEYSIPDIDASPTTQLAQPNCFPIEQSADHIRTNNNNNNSNSSIEGKPIDERLRAMRLDVGSKQQQQQQAALKATTNNNVEHKMDLESARQKLVAQVEKHPFWSNKAAKRMRLSPPEERHVLLYELTSFCERRDLEWRYEPYRGGLQAGNAPLARGPPSPPAGGRSMRSVPPPLSSNSSPPASSIHSASGELFGSSSVAAASTAMNETHPTTRSPLRRTSSKIAAAAPSA